jgi:predicted outer membrane repeat protein
MTHVCVGLSWALRLLIVAAWVTGSLGRFAPARPVMAGTITVGDGFPASCNAATLQDAVELAQATTDFGQIYFNCGAAPHTIVVNPTLVITRSVFMDGGALGQITLSGGNVRRVFDIHGSPAQFQAMNLVIAFGREESGNGGCIYARYGYVYLWDVKLHNCSAGNKSSFQSGSASRGGAIYSESWLSLTDSEVLSSSADIGGAIYSDFNLGLYETRLAGNQASEQGGAVALDGYSTVYEILVEHNTAKQGGGLSLGDTAHATILNSRIYSNTATGGSAMGAAVYSLGQLSITGSQIDGNASDSGAGGIGVLGGTTHVDQSFITRNRAGTIGGAFFANTAVVLTDTHVLSNTARTGGGGGHFDNLTVTGGRFQGNVCTSAACSGGGLSNNGYLHLRDTLFIQNSAGSTGGAIFLSSSSPSELINALLARNTTNAGGATLHSAGGGSLSLYHVTFAGADAPSAPALRTITGTLTVLNTIFATHTVGIHHTGSSGYEDHNLFFNVATPSQGTLVSGGHSFNGDPAFAGPERDDYHLTAASDAVDTGIDVGITTDVDGDPRPPDAPFDIGFDEFTLRWLFLPVVLR